VIVVKANLEIRTHIKKSKIYSWHLADKLGIHENTLFRRLRKELDDKEKRFLIEVIDQIVAELVKNNNLSN
jgi:hypothetical protein